MPNNKTGVHHITVKLKDLYNLKKDVRQISYKL